METSQSDQADDLCRYARGCSHIFCSFYEWVPRSGVKESLTPDYKAKICEGGGKGCPHKAKLDDEWYREYKGYILREADALSP